MRSRSHSLLRTVFFAAAASLFVLIPAGCAQLATDHPSEMAGMLFWPDGDPHAGMQAFKDLKCTQCHRVASVAELAVLTEGPAVGPALDSATAKRARVDILVQIVAPGTDPTIQESHMGNFDDVMTVAQLTDLVAFVESLHGEAGSGM
jgi:hypothetical protein